MSAIVMIHGLFGHLRMPELGSAFERFEVLAPDLVGYGVNRAIETRDLTLQDQANHVIANLEELTVGPVHLLGHSVGGAVACLVARQRPDLLASLTSVEGNFTLQDAFWSRQIAQKNDADVEEIIEGYRRDPQAWMAGSVARRSALSDRLAQEWLDNQPATTIKAQACAVVEATCTEGYLADVRAIMESSLPVHLVAGSRSASGWDVPNWANTHCTSRINIPNTGHLMMVENPKAFATAVEAGFFSN